VLVSLGAAVFVMIPMELSNGADTEAATRVIQGNAEEVFTKQWAGGSNGAAQLRRASRETSANGRRSDWRG
jgi:hypothetical protein